MSEKREVTPELIERFHKWLRESFCYRDPFAGMVEELGEFAHAHIKTRQGIRKRTREDLADAVCDLLVFMADHCSIVGISFLRVLEISRTVNTSYGTGWAFSMEPCFDWVLRYSNGPIDRYEEDRDRKFYLTAVYLLALWLKPGHSKSSQTGILANLVCQARVWFEGEGKDLETELVRVFETVLERQWVKNPEDGRVA